MLTCSVVLLAVLIDNVSSWFFDRISLTYDESWFPQLGDGVVDINLLIIPKLSHVVAMSVVLCLFFLSLLIGSVVLFAAWLTVFLPAVRQK